MKNKINKIWFTSDNHFGHFNIIKYTGRPHVSVLEMETDMITKWNERVSKDDIVYHLGDFSLYGENVVSAVLNKLNGNIVLIKGNHDRKRVLSLFKEVYSSLYLVYGEYLIEMVHNPQNACLDADFVFCGHVHEAWKERTIKNKKVYNVGVDVRGFMPVSFEEIISIQQT